MKNRIRKKCWKKTKGFLTEAEVRILQDQIQKNSQLIDRYILAIDLLVNKERCPKDANTLASLRRKLPIAIEENDTFRKVLWRHVQMVEAEHVRENWIDPIIFLVSQIRKRERSLVAQEAWK